jgi:hypothetical protein
MGRRIVIEPAGQPSKEALADEPRQHLVYGIPAAEIQEAARAEYRPPAGAANPSYGLRMNALHDITP